MRDQAGESFMLAEAEPSARPFFIALFQTSPQTNFARGASRRKLTCGLCGFVRERWDFSADLKYLQS